MKQIILSLFFFVGCFVQAQNKKCEIDFEEKTDSTYVKKTLDYLIYEKDFVNTSDYILFSLINSDNTPYLNFQLLQKSKDFIASKCLDENSKIHLQLANGKIYPLFSAQEVCSHLVYDEKEKNNTRILSGYFMFSKEGYADLKKYPITLVKVKYVSETVDYVMKKELKSTTMKGDFYPENYFIDYLKCIE